jgi:hypothetical protein
MGVRDFDLLSFFLPFELFFGLFFCGDTLLAAWVAPEDVEFDDGKGSTSSPALTFRSSNFNSLESICVSTSAMRPFPLGVPCTPAAVRRRFVGRATYPMYLVSLRMSDGCRSGREKSDVVVAEKKSAGREEGSASGEMASSASKMSSIRDVSFSRGAREVHEDVKLWLIRG